MEERKMQAVESGSLYMTLDAFYKPVYLSKMCIRDRVVPVVKKDIYPR